MKISRLASVACAVLLAATAARAGDPTGSWKWTIQTPTGDAVEVSLKLGLQDGKLTGDYNSRFGTAPITDATFKDDVVAFSVLREFDGNKFTVKYNGKLDGDAIKGSIEFPGFGGADPVKMDWNASRVK
jgi:hypothetical protein